MAVSYDTLPGYANTEAENIMAKQANVIDSQPKKLSEAEQYVLDLDPKVVSGMY